MTRPPYSTRTQRYVRARAVANMLGSIQIFRPVASEMSADTLLVTARVRQLIYMGPARIYTTSGSSILVGESVVGTSQTTVSVPYDATGIRKDDICQVLSFGADPELEHDTFSIQDVGGGGLIRATRQLSVMAYQASRWWEA